MVVLKERQFYNVSTRKKVTVPADNIKIVKFKNGAHALQGVSKEDVKMFKIISESDLQKMEKKYGKSKRYRRSS